MALFQSLQFGDSTISLTDYLHLSSPQQRSTWNYQYQIHCNCWHSDCARSLHLDSQALLSWWKCRQRKPGTHSRLYGSHSHYFLRRSNPRCFFYRFFELEWVCFRPILMECCYCRDLKSIERMPWELPRAFWRLFDRGAAGAVGSLSRSRDCYEAPVPSFCEWRRTCRHLFSSILNDPLQNSAGNYYDQWCWIAPSQSSNW